MYTEEMKMAFHSVTPPKGFWVDLIDNDNFITVVISEVQIFKMSHDEKIEAVEYIARVKKALEDTGSIVLLTRSALK